MADTQPQGYLTGVRVVEWGEGVAAPYAARLLGDLGAEVVKVESGDGDRSRRHGPFADPARDPNRSGLFHTLNFDKRSVVCDLDRAGDADALLGLIAGADILISDRPLALRRRLGLAGPAAAERFPALVNVSVTAYGDDGPYAGLPGCSLTAAALGAASWVIGDPDRPPLTLPFDIADYAAGSHAAGAALAALVARERGAGGQLVDIGVAEVIASFVSLNASFYIAFGKPWQRAGRRASGSGGAYPYAIMPCADGHVTIIGRSQRDWESIVAAMGSPAWAADPRFADAFEISRERPDEADALVLPWMRQHNRAELLALAEQHRFALAPVLSAAEVLEHPHYRARGVFRPVAALGAAGGAPVSVPVSPLFQLTEPAARPVAAAPSLAGRAEVAAAAPWAVASRSERPPAPRGERRLGPHPDVRSAPLAAPTGALAGIRVIDFTWVWSGPMVGAMLADLGAEVIKIEHPGRLDNSRLRGRPVKDGKPVEGPVEEISPYFHENNRNKLSVSLNLKDDADAEVLRRLIDESDVVLDNYTPGALDRAGLGYEALASTNPALVMLSMSAAGKTGPMSAIRGYAPIMSALSGLESLVGYDDDPAIGMMTFGLGDPNAASHAVIAVLGALARRERNGLGAFIDLSQAEALVSVLGEALVQAQLPAGDPGGDPGARSMRHPAYCPHGHYPCAGSDSWVAIAVGSDDDWQRFTEALGSAPLAADPRFATDGGRRRHPAELDAALAAATRGRSRDELVAQLRQAGIAVAPVLDYPGMRSDPHLTARGAFREVVHPLTGTELLTALPWHLRKTPPTLRRSAPLVGEHTDEVLARVLGLAATPIDHVERPSR